MCLRHSKHYVIICCFIVITISIVFADISQNGLFDYSMLPEKNFIDRDIPRNALDQSIGILQQLIEESPLNVDLYIALAQNYSAIDDYDRAIEYLKSAAEIEPENAKVYYVLGKTYEIVGENEQGISAFEKMVSIDYLNAQNHLHLGIAYLKRSNFELARREFRKGIEIDPTIADAYYYLGLISLTEKEYSEALDNFLISINYNSTLYQALNNIGMIYLSQQKESKSLSYLKKSIEINPNYGAGNFNLANLLIKKGYFDEAQAKLEKTLLGEPLNEKAHYLLGLIHEELNQIKSAINKFSFLSQQYPQNVNYTLILARLYTRAKQYSKAKSSYDSIVKSGAMKANILVDYGAVLEELKSYDQAAGMYKKAIAESPRYHKAHFYLFKYYIRNRRLNEAFSELLKSGTYLYSSLTIIIMVIFFILVVGFALKIFFQHS